MWIIWRGKIILLPPDITGGGGASAISPLNYATVSYNF